MATTVLLAYGAMTLFFIKRKMLDLGFFYIGVGLNHAEMTHEWSMWFKELGIARMTISQRARDALDSTLLISRMHSSIRRESTASAEVDGLKRILE